jgi:hypothetical protein
MSMEMRFKSMKHWLATLVFVSILGTSAFAAPKGPQVDLIDNKLSVSAEGVTVGQLLQLVDLATGMKSKVPPELANRKISVRFSGLSMTDGVRKIFEGQPLDYVMIQGQGIVITSASQAGSTGGDALPYSPQPAVQSFDQPFVQEFQGGFQQPPNQGFQQPQNQQQMQQPPTIQTPFGQMPNPRAAQPQQPMQNPLNAPGQVNPLFPGQGNNNGQVPVQIVPANQANPNQFGTPSPFGTPNQPTANPNNSLFGSVPVLNPGGPPR